MENSWQKNLLKRKISDRIYIGLVYASALIAVIPLVSVVSYVFFKGITAINLDFFTNLPAPVGEPGGGMGNAIVGTLIIVSLACLFALPVGILGGIWLAQFGRGKRGFLIRYAADVLSSIPSIVIGIFVYISIVLIMKRFSAIAGGMALAIIMIPTVTRTTEEMIKMVPRALYETGLALGLPEWKVTLQIVLRTAWNGIFTGIILAAARVFGETAPLLFTAFGSMYWNLQIDQPMASMTVQIYNYAISPFQEWQAQAWAGALALMFFVLSVTIFVRRKAQRVRYG